MSQPSRGQRNSSTHTCNSSSTQAPIAPSMRGGGYGWIPTRREREHKAHQDYDCLKPRAPLAVSEERNLSANLHLAPTPPPAPSNTLAMRAFALRALGASGWTNDCSHIIKAPWMPLLGAFGIRSWGQHKFAEVRTTVPWV